MSSRSSVSKPNGKKSRRRKIGEFRRCRHRRILRGATHLVTKKCTNDLFLILPSRIVNKILKYALFVCAAKYGIIVHGYIFMSNHFHLVVTDPRGRLPDFMRDFLKDTSAALQAATPVDQPVWDRRRYDSTHLLDLDAAMRKLVYVDLNSSRAGLTRPEEWPGLTSMTEKVGVPLYAERPNVYFSKRRPDVAECRLVPLSETFLGALFEETEREIEDLRRQELRSIEAGLEAKGRS